MNDFLVLLTRCKDEPYILEFVNHYLSEGVDRIHIIDDASTLVYPEEVLLNERVTVYWEKDIIRKKQANKIYQQIRYSSKWLMFVDVDEFITSRKPFFKTIRQLLETTFANADLVKVPWVMMSCNKRASNPTSLLKENTHRWNHDQRHDNDTSDINKFRCRYEKIEIKSIFKPDLFDLLWDHHPKEPIKELKIVESVTDKNSELTPFYENLRESDIKNAILVCYHYRIISVEHSEHKIKTNIWYSDYKLEDLLSTDYPEIIDNTLRIKTILRTLFKKLSSIIRH